MKLIRILTGLVSQIQMQNHLRIQLFRDLKRHINAVHVHTPPTSMFNLWKSLWYQMAFKKSTFLVFMKRRSHITVQFVKRPLAKKIAWKNIMLLFIKEKRLNRTHLNVQFVKKPLTKKVAWKNIRLLFMKKKKDSQNTT